MNKEELLSRIGDLTSVVISAREGLAKDEVVDMEGIDEDVREACSAITDLSPDDAIAVRPHLTELLEGLQNFSGELQEKLTAIEEQTDDTAKPEAGDAEPRKDSADDEND